MPQLHLDLNGPTNYLTTPWAFGTNVASAASLLRADVRRHLLLGRDELGFRHVRFPGVFDDAVRVLGPGGAYDFTRLEQAVDWLMEQGMSPFFCLSGVPAAMATPDSPLPADPERWADMARALAAFVDGRYGCDAQEWHFEVWPGADDPASWPGDREAFFRLYDLTARGIKSVNPRLRVGGPSAADPAWVEAFVAHVAGPSEAFGLDGQRCDFVTVDGHPAGGQSVDPTTVGQTVGQTLGQTGGGTGGPSGGPPGVSALAARAAAVRTVVTASLGETTPVILSSWGPGGRASSPEGPAAPESDRCAAGGFAAAAMAALADVVGGALYESMSDADQPSPGVRSEPFHGGRGLVTVNEIRKASFNALKLLNEHVGYRVDWRWDDPTDGLTVFVSKDYHNLIRVLAAYDRRPGSSAGGPARFTIEGLPESVRYGQVQVLRPSAGSPLEAWAALGEPRFVNRLLLEDLEAASQPATAEVNFVEFPPRLEPGMTLQLTIPLPDDVMYTD